MRDKEQRSKRKYLERGFLKKKKKKKKKKKIGERRGVQWLRIHLPIQGTWVQTLVRELRSHMPWGN